MTDSRRCRVGRVREARHESARRRVCAAGLADSAHPPSGRRLLTDDLIELDDDAMPLFRELLPHQAVEAVVPQVGRLRAAADLEVVAVLRRLVDGELFLGHELELTVVLLAV